jgi:hypothetical protein
MKKIDKVTKRAPRVRTLSADQLRPVIGGADGGPPVAQTAKGIIDSIGR